MSLLRLIREFRTTGDLEVARVIRDALADYPEQRIARALGVPVDLAACGLIVNAGNERAAKQNTDIINRALASGQSVVFPPGPIHIWGEIVIDRSNVEISHGHLIQRRADSCGIAVGGPSKSSGSAINIRMCSNVAIRYMTLEFRAPLSQRELRARRRKRRKKRRGY